jgi:hypothetical protein
MPVSIGYQPDKRAVVIVSTGTVTLDELGCQSPLAVYLLKQHSATRMLVDYRDAQVQVSTLDVYALPERYEALGLSRSVRIAVVLPRGLDDTELFEFYTDVTHNRGYMTRLFESVEDAQRWLETTA